MSVKNLKKLASGRVWSGLQAESNGLVDAFGGLNDAVKMAAKMADVSYDYDVVYYPKDKLLIEEIFSDWSEEIQARWIKNELGEYYQHYKYLKDIEQFKGIQARMPYIIDIE